MVDYNDVPEPTRDQLIDWIVACCQRMLPEKEPVIIVPTINRIFDPYHNMITISLLQEIDFRLTGNSGTFFMEAYDFPMENSIIGTLQVINVGIFTFDFVPTYVSRNDLFISLIIIHGPEYHFHIDVDEDEKVLAMIAYCDHLWKQGFERHNIMHIMYEVFEDDLTLDRAQLIDTFMFGTAGSELCPNSIYFCDGVRFDGFTVYNNGLFTCDLI